ncbi:MAG: Stp1/IreP family PP2C-type Ser/Thr phosphatase [Myxococcota bacterium]
MSDTEITEGQNPAWGAREPLIAGATDVGVVRRVNQDAFGRFDDQERGEILLVVADGLGGHRGGETASKMAIKVLGERFSEGDGDPSTRLVEAIRDANEKIYSAAKKDRTLDGMGTTVVCLLMTNDGRSFVAHVGDSRLYRLRGPRLETMTEDHSLVATLVREGVLTEEDAWSDPRRNQILRALGVRQEVEIEIAPIELLPGDLYLLCSDGLNGMIQDPQIAQVAVQSHILENVAQDMIDAANEAGGTDNITCMLARIPDPDRFTTLRGQVENMVGGAMDRLRTKRPE